MTALLVGLADPLAICPKCHKIGRRLGARPIDNAPVFHCLACGRVWPDPPTLTDGGAEVARRGRR